MTETINNETASPATESPKLVFDGVEYEIAQLSEEARNQIGNVRACDMEIARLRQQMAILQTARNAYANALKQSLPQQ